MGGPVTAGACDLKESRDPVREDIMILEEWYPRSILRVCRPKMQSHLRCDGGVLKNMMERFRETRGLSHTHEISCTDHVALTAFPYRMRNDMHVKSALPIAASLWLNRSIKHPCPLYRHSLPGHTEVQLMLRSR